MKTCKECNETRPYSFFNKGENYKDGYHTICRECHYKKYGREWHFKKTYGIDIEDFNIMRRQQDYKCACCGTHENEVTRKRLFIDHNHKTGEVRALLCHSCNVSLGLLKEDPERIASLLSYLKEHNG